MSGRWPVHPTIGPGLCMRLPPEGSVTAWIRVCARIRQTREFSSVSTEERPSKERLLSELASSGISAERVLNAVADVPREAFVPPELRARAYENVALPIGENQTISQPVVVAHMVQAVHPSHTDHVLEIGTGSGYGAAVLSRVAGDVVTVEIRPRLAELASRRLQDLGYDNIRVVLSDGSVGWPDLAPYDAIVVTAASPSLPPELLKQLS